MNLRKIAGVLAVAVMAGGTLLGAGQAAYATSIPQPGGEYELNPPFFNTNAAKCLDVPGGSTTRGERLQVFHCHGSGGPGAAVQLWSFLNRGTSVGGPYEIINKSSSLCVNIVLNAGGTPGTQALQNSCLGTPTGEWVVHPVSQVPGDLAILSNVQFPGMCLATSNSSGNDHTPVVIDTCDFNLTKPTWIRQVWNLA